MTTPTLSELLAQREKLDQQIQAQKLALANERKMAMESLPRLMDRLGITLNDIENALRHYHENKALDSKNATDTTSQATRKKLKALPDVPLDVDEEQVQDYFGNTVKEDEAPAAETVGANEPTNDDNSEKKSSLVKSGGGFYGLPPNLSK